MYEVRLSSDKLEQVKIIKGAHVSTRTTDDAVSFSVRPADAHSRRLVPGDQSQPASEGLARKKLMARSELLAGQVTLAAISAQF